MGKQEFLAVLQQSLSGEIPDYEVENNVRYYDSYLAADRDKSEEEKIRELGEPRLIAKTIIDTYMVNRGGSSYRIEHYSRGYDEGYDETVQEENNKYGKKVKYYSWNTMKWYQKILIILVGIVLVTVLIGLITLGINIFFSIVLPFMLIIFVVRAVINLFR